MPIFKDERRTAGAILAEMLLREEAGENVDDLKQEFQEKSAQQLGISKANFSIEWGSDDK